MDITENQPIFSPETLARHNYQWELVDQLYAEFIVEPDGFSQWEQNFIQSCYSLLRNSQPDFCLTQTQQEKLDDIALKIWGDD
jgi:hypothetical protein